ncbi:alpha/beta hydrolase [Roseateles sp. BYS180W]|uniref:Alpha/beta hydrolase n=1 Tax=Roseateles rivi TaxID=3299028 RepID=A0ABW7FY73_9BURK
MRTPLLAFTLFCCSLTAALGAESAMELKTPTGSLFGTLSEPETGAPAPVVLIIAGSGPTDRNGNGPVAQLQSNNLKQLADALSSAGIASVRYDKRGVAESVAAATAEADLRFDHFVRDAADWLAMLGTDKRFSRVGVIGHSEGALIATMAAQTQRSLSALVLIAGAGESAGATLRRQLAGRLPATLAARNEEVLKTLEQGKTVPDAPPELAALYRPSVQPYLISWIKIQPEQELAKTKAPCLILQGDTDIQVQVSDAKRLSAAQSRCQLSIVTGMNHVLKQVEADPQQQMASYGNPSLPLAPEFTRVLVDFLARALGKR